MRLRSWFRSRFRATRLTQASWFSYTFTRVQFRQSWMKASWTASSAACLLGPINAKVRTSTTWRARNSASGEDQVCRALATPSVTFVSSRHSPVPGAPFHSCFKADLLLARPCHSPTNTPFRVRSDDKAAMKPFKDDRDSAKQHHHRVARFTVVQQQVRLGLISVRGMPIFRRDLARAVSESPQ